MYVVGCVCKVDLLNTQLEYGVRYGFCFDVSIKSNVGVLDICSCDCVIVPG